MGFAGFAGEFWWGKFEVRGFERLFEVLRSL
jgi:hypothetical protein